MKKTKEKIKKIKKSLKQYVPKGLGKLTNKAFIATYIPAIPEHLKRVKRANVMQKQRKASTKHIGKKETYSGKIAAGQKTRKIMGTFGMLFPYPERRNALGFKYKTGKTSEGRISAIRKSMRRLPIKHLKTFGKGGAVKKGVNLYKAKEKYWNSLVKKYYKGEGPMEMMETDPKRAKELGSLIGKEMKKKFGKSKGGIIKKVGKEVMSYVGKKVHKKKPVVKKPVTKKSTNPYSLADWKQGIKHKGKGYSRGGAIKKGITIIVDSKGKAKIKASVKQVKERAEKELEDFIKDLNPKKFKSGGLVKPKSVRIAKRGWGKAIR